VVVGWFVVSVVSLAKVVVVSPIAVV